MAQDGWALQYPEPEEPPTREDLEEAKAQLTPDQRQWLGLPN